MGSSRGKRTVSKENNRTVEPKENGTRMMYSEKQLRSCVVRIIGWSVGLVIYAAVALGFAAAVAGLAQGAM